MALLAAVIWSVAAVVGLGGLWRYSVTPGDPGKPTDRWPTASRLVRDSERPTLVMLAHPQCPCSRASVGELALAMARLRGELTAYVVFVQPQGFADAWAETDLWRSAKAIPGVTVVRDEGGAEAERFGGATSGETLLYDARGQLLFSGGITAARGHSGDNTGRSAIISLVSAGSAGGKSTPVFGCSLFGHRLLDSEAR